MTSYEIQPIDRQRKEMAKRAIAMAMQNRWPEAVETNTAILSDFPEDLEAYNRLGKAMSEQGRVGEAKDAFQRALDISPHNSIARKNLDRLMKVEDADVGSGAGVGRAGHTFIEESGKAGVTSLMSVAPANVLVKEAPGRSVKLEIDGGALKVYGLADECLGQVEPRLASRLTRLMKSGNRYEAAVTSVGERELSVIIREVYHHPSQADVVSFPLRAGVGVYLQGTTLGYDPGDEEFAEPTAVKDWSSDDTEPGDDDAFSPVVHRIISSATGGGESEDEA